MTQPAVGRLLCLCWLLSCASGCGLWSGGQQLKQLQMENDRLLAEYRAQRERLTKLQDTNAALEARVGEAERLLAQSGLGMPSSRISQTPARTAPPANSQPAQHSGGSAPPYVPPSIPSLPGSGTAGSQASGSQGSGSQGSGSQGSGSVKWRPLHRQ